MTPDTTSSAPYGFCPICGAPGKLRERRPNGNDICEKGHTYPSRDAKSTITSGQAHITPAELEEMQGLCRRQFLLADRICTGEESGESDDTAIEEFRANTKKVGMAFPRCIAEIERLRAAIKDLPGDLRLHLTGHQGEAYRIALQLCESILS